MSTSTPENTDQQATPKLSADAAVVIGLLLIIVWALYRDDFVIAGLLFIVFMQQRTNMLLRALIRVKAERDE